MLNKLGIFAIAAMVMAGVQAQAGEPELLHHKGGHYFLGQWDCDGHVHTPDGRKVTTVGVWNFHKSFHGRIYDYFENHTGDGFTYWAKGLTTYDHLTDTLNRHVVSKMATWTRYVSSGWADGDTWVWRGESHRFGPQPPTPIEQVIERKDDDTFEVHVRVQDRDRRSKDGDDEWKNMYHATCSRRYDNDHGGKADTGKAEQDDADEAQANDTSEQGNGNQKSNWNWW